MEVISVNRAEAREIVWKGKIEVTGIFKHPVQGPLVLEHEAVQGDIIADRRVHGGIHKACYLYSCDHYPYWKKKFPDLDWNWGMFGENLSIAGMDEGQLALGNIYEIGSALVQISMPREPCYKLGLRFGSQRILKEFIAFANPGAYVRVLESGRVGAGDILKLVEPSRSPVSVRDCFQLYYAKEKSQEVLRSALANEGLPDYKKTFLQRFLP